MTVEFEEARTPRRRGLAAFPASVSDTPTYLTSDHSPLLPKLRAILRCQYGYGFTRHTFNKSEQDKLQQLTLKIITVVAPPRATTP